MSWPKSLRSWRMRRRGDGPWCSTSIPMEIALPFKEIDGYLNRDLMMFWGCTRLPATDNAIFFAFLSSSERVPADFNIIIFVRLLHAFVCLLTSFFPFFFTTLFPFPNIIFFCRMSGQGKLSNYFLRSSILGCYWLLSRHSGVPANFCFLSWRTRLQARAR